MAQTGRVVKNGRLKQSVSRWCYGKIPLPDFAKAVKEIGLTAIDLLGVEEWPVVQDAGLICSMGYAGGGTRMRSKTMRSGFLSKALWIASSPSRATSTVNPSNSRLRFRPSRIEGSSSTIRIRLLMAWTSPP